MSTSQLWNPPLTEDELPVWSTANYIDHTDINYAISRKSSVIAGLNIAATGSGYTSAPTVIIGPPDLPGGIQATAIFTLVSSNLELSLTNPGVGYSHAPIVTVTGGGGSGLVVEAVVNYIKLQVFQLDPIPLNDLGSWNTNHQLVHLQMLAATNQQSSDLGNFDPNDREGMIEYVFDHIQDHNSVRNALTGYLPTG
jgi:hypothetical protein